MSTFFTADTHFGHDNIVPICGRPFMDPAYIAAWKACKEHSQPIPPDLKERLEAGGRQMDEELIARWNETVRPTDHIWHLGDFHRSKKSRPADYLRRLNGVKHLVRGNHDTDATWAHAEWAFSRHYAELRLNGTNLVLFHYALRTWNGSYAKKGKQVALQLFGHSHGKLQPLPWQCDVGVDCWDFKPVTLDQIKDRMGSNG